MRMPNSRQISEEQEEIYEEAPMDGTVMIAGPPGTGKTVIAFLRAQALNRQNKSAKVLMYNRVLQKYTDNIADDEGDSVLSSTLTSWIAKWWRAHRIETNSGAKDRIDLNCPYDQKDEAKKLGAKWDKRQRTWYVLAKDFKGNESAFARWITGQRVNATDIQPPKLSEYKYDWQEMLVSALKHGAMNDWGHLIIDEAQDFPEAMFSFLRVIAAQLDNGGLTILADDNQRLNEEENSTIDQIKKALAIPPDRYFLLEENFRNTYEISRLANEFFVGLSTGKPKPPKRRGDKPQLVRADSLDAQVDYIVNVLSARAPGEVGVLANNDQMRDAFFKKLHQRLHGKYRVQSYSSNEKHKENHPVEDMVFDKAGTLTVLNRQSCKGLEFDFVFIPQLQTIDIDGSAVDAFKMNMYVMCSRARDALFLLYTASSNQSIPVLEYLPKQDSGILEYKNV